ncbi:MAG: hypothetical protein JJT81_19910 [Rubellimicrobium sp.]|nr:hypothetical protein [Rubellimicrobium sp.]
MIRGVLFLPVFWLISACAPDFAGSAGAVPAGAVPVIELSQGTPFSGMVVISYRADEVWTMRRFGGGLNEATEARGVLAPGTFGRLAAILAAEGPAVLAGLPQDGAICMDYGEDRIRAMPQVGPISEISAVCPHQPLLDLKARLLAEADARSEAR